jgi:hypothetical protein
VTLLLIRSGHTIALSRHVGNPSETLEIENTAAEIMLRAERKAGAMLAATELSTGGRPRKTSDTASRVSVTLQDLGVKRKQSSRWQAIAVALDAIAGIAS